MPPSRTDMLWTLGEDEAVEVNQRALIDKILARYSGENTIFRELLQNADDAGAQHVQIKYYTEAGVKRLELESSADARKLKKDESGNEVVDLPDLKKSMMARYVVSNDGIPFRPQDWQRLKKIAEGNPDEEKIGAFGVGFYSLWSVCENPLVESGDKWMGFYWKDGKDQLLARSGALPPPTTPSAPTLSGNPWTTFTMDLRSPAELEAPMDFARFLVTSLTFMRSMRQIDMLIDDTKVLSVTKATGANERVDTSSLGGPKGLQGRSPGGVMNVQAVDATGMVITAKVMRYLAASGFTPPPLPPPEAISTQTSSFASMLSSALWSRPKPVASPAPTPVFSPAAPPQDPMEFNEKYMQLKIFQADIAVSVGRDFGRELERATKKAPPQRTSLSLIFSTGKPISISGLTSDEDDGVFAGLSPREDGESTGRIFIGQATGQTTGIGGHIAARFIPTVERESIDLVDRHVSHWNKELLYIGGYVARAVYEVELQECLRTKTVDEDSKNAVKTRAAHALQFFTYHTSTPSPIVSRDMELAFFACARDPTNFPIMSNLGVRQASDVRLPHPVLSTFLQGMPTLLDETLSSSSRMVARLKERGLLREPSMDDVIRELSTRPLNEQEMVDCLKWWLSLSGLKEYSSTLRGKLIDAAIFTMKVDDVETVVPLSLIRTFINPRTSAIPTDVPLPTHTLPYVISKQLAVDKLYPVFGWSELSLPDFLSFLCSPPMSGCDGAKPETDLSVSPVFAERVFSILSRAWPQASSQMTAEICNILKGVSCVPTRTGMKKPAEAYFDSVKLFPDLAIIALPRATPIRGPLEKVFLALGVRRTVDLQLVFSRLVGGGEWSVADLVKYLVSVRDTLTTEEISKLKKTAAFPLEVKGVNQPTANHDTATVVKAKIERRMPSQLYEPTDTLRSLGLPLLDWGNTKWKQTSEEAKLLFSFGLRRFPPVELLLSMAATEGAERQAALKYLLAHLDTHYAGFRVAAHSTVAFLPAIKPDGTTFLARPGEVFINPECQILGFAIVQELLLDNQSAIKLGVLNDPPTALLANTLAQNPPASRAQAVQVFEYMATRIGVAAENDLALLRKAKFIPVTTEASETPGAMPRVQHARPSEVYFASTDSAQSLYQSFFTYVDMGERANNFLRACGVKSEPSILEVTSLIIKNPQRFLDLAGTPERYQMQLRQVAANFPSLPYATRSAMKMAPFLLASQLVPQNLPLKKRMSTEKSNGDATELEEMVHVWKLAKASEIAIIDDMNPYHLFGGSVLAAPQETLLEDFYGQLGSKLLSTLVHEEFRVETPTSTSTPLAVNLKKLVLERLALFLAEPRRKSSDISLEWLKKEGNFQVVQVRGLKVKRTYKYAGAERSNIQPVSASATRDRNKVVTLSISGSLEPDYYEVASALVKVLFKASRPDEPLLLMTILSTPLQALRRRYNVDRILNQQRAERLEFEAQLTRERDNRERETKEHLALVPSITSGGTVGSPQPAKSSDLIQKQSAATTGSSPTRKTSFMDRFKRRSSHSSTGSYPNAMNPASTISSTIGSGLGNAGTSFAGIGGGSGGTGSSAAGAVPQRHGVQPPSTKQPTSVDDIKNTVRRAVAASRPESGTNIVDKQSLVSNVKESSDMYCDVSGVTADLSFVETLPSGLKLFIPSDVRDRISYVAEHRDVCDRFAAAIIQPIGAVFKLLPASLHIFIDHQGPLIAFNRGGSLFMNARFYRSWHDEQVLANNRGEALVSWYFSIAHELAHNLELAHNSTHEFYFSSISETFLVPFMKLLQQDGAV